MNAVCAIVKLILLSAMETKHYIQNKYKNRSI